MSNAVGPYGNVEYSPPRQNEGIPALVLPERSNQPVEAPTNSEKFAPNFVPQVAQGEEYPNLLQDVIEYLKSVFGGEYTGYGTLVFVFALSFFISVFVVFPMVMAWKEVSDDRMYIPNVDFLKFYNSFDWWKIWLYKIIYIILATLFGPIYLMYQFGKNGFK